LNRDDGFSPKDGGNVVHHGDEECPAEGFHILEVWNRRASPPPAEPGLRAEDLRRLAIYSVATCDINGGNKRDRPAILLEQAITALALTPPQKPADLQVIRFEQVGPTYLEVDMDDLLETLRALADKWDRDMGGSIPAEEARRACSRSLRALIRNDEESRVAPDESKLALLPGFTDIRGRPGQRSALDPYGNRRPIVEHDVAPAANTEGLREDEQGMHWKKRAYDTLAKYGVPFERARSIANGIRVLATRYEKEIEALRASPPPVDPGLRLTFEQVRDGLLSQKATSEYRQVAIVLVRSVFTHASWSTPPKWACDDCMMRDMTEAEGNAHHASTGHSVSSK
jgi:hypothetical protein